MTTNQPTVNPQTTETNNPTGQQTVQFDINNLPPEFQRYVDQERTKASQTARDKAERQANMTMNEQISAINQRLSQSEVSRIFGGVGLSEENLTSLVGMVATDDVERSIANAQAFKTIIDSIVETKMQQQTQQAIQQMPTPSAGGSVTEQQFLQAQLDEARKDTTRMRDVKVSAIMRAAAEKNIILN